MLERRLLEKDPEDFEEIVFYSPEKVEDYSLEKLIEDHDYLTSAKDGPRERIGDSANPGMKLVLEISNGIRFEYDDIENTKESKDVNEALKSIFGEERLEEYLEN